MNCDSIIIDGKLYNYNFDQNNIHIDESHKESKRYFAPALVWIKEQHPGLNVWNRSMKSLQREWATHNLLYAIDFRRDQTGSVDLDYPCDKPEWVYNVLGFIAWLFIA